MIACNSIINTLQQVQFTIDGKLVFPFKFLDLVPVDRVNDDFFLVKGFNGGMRVERDGRIENSASIQIAIGTYIGAPPARPILKGALLR